VRVTGQIAAGLDALHRAGLIHRDIKPSNILFDEEGVSSLTDFGLAKGTDYTALTAAGQVVGTLGHLAPELIRGADVAPSSDIYALGCVVFECLSGSPPFAAATMFQVGLGHLEEQPSDPCAKRPDAPPGFSEIARHALAKEPGGRPPTATAYARMLFFAAIPRPG